jgi:hypothetical protein
MGKRRIGLVGFGHVGEYRRKRPISQHPCVYLIQLQKLLYYFAGKYLYEFICSRENLEISFVWNRTQSVLDEAGIPADLILSSLEDVESRYTA